MEQCQIHIFLIQLSLRCNCQTGVNVTLINQSKIKKYSYIHKRTTFGKILYIQVFCFKQYFEP